MYRGAVANLIHHYKTGERLSLARYFSLRLTPLIHDLCAQKGLASIEVTLVPIPPRLEKLRSGKCDQVGILAQSLNRIGFMTANALVRLPHSVQQKTLARADRFKNASKAYALKSSKVPKHIILIDDVVTTGATLYACADILRKAGSNVVAAAVIAAD